MKGLDSYIMGLNDPNAPFNQTDWPELVGYSDVLDKCSWITDAMLEDDKTYFELEKIFTEVLENFQEDYFGKYEEDEDGYPKIYIDKNELQLAILICAKDLATETKEKYSLHTKQNKMQLEQAKRFYAACPLATKVYMAMQTKLPIGFIVENWNEITK